MQNTLQIELQHEVIILEQEIRDWQKALLPKFLQNVD